MALSAGALASLIQGNLEAQGAIGSNLAKFCTGIANGIVESIVGKSFTTADVGLTPGAGIGTGTGITGLSSSTMQTAALAAMHSRGSNAPKMMSSLMDAVVSHLASSAGLSTVNAPVFQGVGTIVVGSIAVSASEMGGNIASSLASQGGNGSNASELSHAIATGICTGILASGTGSVVITGGAPPTPVPGTGAGVGTIS